MLIVGLLRKMFNNFYVTYYVYILCISSVLLKIVCSLLNNRVLIQVKQRNLINKNQTGFKEKHRTADNLLTLKNVVKKYVTIGKGKLYACFVDFKKAYDSVWHEGLFCKMRRNNLQGRLLDLIIDIYKKTKCAVKMGGVCTEFFEGSTTGLSIKSNTI